MGDSDIVFAAATYFELHAFEVETICLAVFSGFGDIDSRHGDLCVG